MGIVRMNRLASSCRLTVSRLDVEVVGSVPALRDLAEAFGAEDDEVMIELADGSGTIVRRRNESSLLKVSVAAGPSLVIEGSQRAIDLIIDVIEGVSEEAATVKRDTVQRHAHVEWLGQDDRWRDPATTPLVVVATWPDDEP